jgi:hypothetical protein
MIFFWFQNSRLLKTVIYRIASACTVNSNVPRQKGLCSNPYSRYATSHLHHLSQNQTGHWNLIPLSHQIARHEEPDITWLASITYHRTLKILP